MFVAAFVFDVTFPTFVVVIPTPVRVGAPGNAWKTATLFLPKNGCKAESRPLAPTKAGNRRPAITRVNTCAVESVVAAGFVLIPKEAKLTVLSGDNTFNEFPLAVTNTSLVPAENDTKEFELDDAITELRVNVVDVASVPLPTSQSVPFTMQ
jgi:hypothetical protein